MARKTTVGVLEPDFAAKSGADVAIDALDLRKLLDGLLAKRLVSRVVLVLQQLVGDLRGLGVPPACVGDRAAIAGVAARATGSA